MEFNKKDLLSQSNLYARVKKLLVSYEWSDCCFVICGKELRAHKLILGISSPVFEAMFYGPLASKDDIVIPDIAPEIFQLLLNYMYTDCVELNSIEDAFELLYASRKYMLEQLSNMCISYIINNISVDNVIEVLNYSDYIQDSQLISYSLTLFCEHANYLLKKNREIINFSCMKAILESDEINIKEVNLIKEVFKWTKHYCKQNKLPDTNENRQDVLFKKGLFNLLRFHTLTLDEFEDIKDDAKCLLLPQELDHIRNKILNKKNLTNKNGMDIVSSPRKSLELHWYYCHRNPLKSRPPLVIDSANSTYQCRIQADKTLFIHSLCIPTRVGPIINFLERVPNKYNEELTISIVSDTDNKAVETLKFTNTVEYDSITMVNLSSNCLFKKDKWYKIIFSWPKNICDSYLYGVELREAISFGFNRTRIQFDDLTRSGGCFIEGFSYK